MRLAVGIRDEPDTVCSNHSWLPNKPPHVVWHPTITIPPFYHPHDSVGQEFSENTDKWLKQLEMIVKPDEGCMSLA